MSHDLTLQLSDEVFNALSQEATVTGATPAQVVIHSLERRFGKKNDLRTEAEKQAARERFERHIGSVDLGYPTGVDNEQIDADLVREYENTHEDG